MKNKYIKIALASLIIFTCSAQGIRKAAAAPAAISDLSATPGDGSVTLTWSAPSPGITDYLVYSGPDSGTNICHPDALPDANCTETDTHAVTTTKTIGSLTNDTEYSFAVYAVNSDGTSGPSNVQTATPSAATNCPGLSSTQSCAVSKIQADGLSFTKIPANVAFISAQNNSNLPSYTNAAGTDDQDILSVNDLRDQPDRSFEVQLSASPFATTDTAPKYIPLKYMYVGTSLAGISGATQDAANGIEYAAGCFGPTNDVTSSVNVQPTLTTWQTGGSVGPNPLGILSTFETSGINPNTDVAGSLNAGDTTSPGNNTATVPVVLMTAPEARRRCTISEAVSYAIDLASFKTALGSKIPAGTYSTTLTYTLIDTSHN
jgi:hypothetical protein